MTKNLHRGKSDNEESYGKNKTKMKGIYTNRRLIFYKKKLLTLHKTFNIPIFILIATSGK
jgi:hypothetical protein